MILATHMDYIYHITTHQALIDAKAAGEYTAPTLETEGFIHCSALHQVIPVANAFYKDSPALILLEIDTTKLTSELKWEPPAHPDPDNPAPVDEQDKFPHIYGAINLDAVVDAPALLPDYTDSSSVFQLPLLLQARLASWEGIPPDVYLGEIAFLLKTSITAINGYNKLLQRIMADNAQAKQLSTQTVEHTASLQRLNDHLLEYVKHLREDSSEGSK